MKEHLDLSTPCVETYSKKRLRVSVRKDNNSGHGSKTLARLVLLSYLHLPLDWEEGTANHACDNETCLNPLHLYLGTQKENLEDARRNGNHFGDNNGGNRSPNWWKCYSPQGTITYRLGINRAATFADTSPPCVSRAAKLGSTTKQGWRFTKL